MQTVQQLCDQPTAEEIYDKAAQQCPNLSLGTVYRNLNSLVEAGREMCIRDRRAGAAMVVAALMADGTSEIEEIGHIERGYENIVEKLRGLGADISKVERMPAALEQAL